MGMLINIDNGGTLTDICVIAGERIYYTKTLTTPYDLSQCFIDGLKKAATVVYGEERVRDLLRHTDCIRYSTTQGTNALVERRGPCLGLILAQHMSASALRDSAVGGEMLAALVGERIAQIDSQLADDAYDAALVQVVNILSEAGASRLVVSLSRARDEVRFKRVWLRRFPRHLLGAVPVLFSHEIADDPDDARRTWTALFNAFLHPAMEHFLYHAEHILRDHKYLHPLLIFRNDGDSARVAKTIAIKTYSCGPRAGLEGARALAANYGLARLISLDVGGTTTDIGVVEANVIRSRRRGEVEGIPVSFALSDIASIGAGGSSIITVRDGEIGVGPQSAGAAPGPACFGLGGSEATITDVFLLLGVFDPASFFGGEITLDRQRAEGAVSKLAEALGLCLESALLAIERAWVTKIAAAISAHVQIGSGAAAVAFGGAGPLAACAVAEQVGIRRVIIPGLAAVFSAFGIGFSDIAQHYEARLSEPTEAGLQATLAELLQRAQRDMFAEGIELAQCTRELRLLRLRNGVETVVALDGKPALPPGMQPGDQLSLSLRAVKALAHATLAPPGAPPSGSAVAGGTRRVRLDDGWRDLPVFNVAAQPAGATGAGPAIIEEPFFTCRVPAAWRFDFKAGGDIVLESEPREES
ncbi:MAG: hydantoinase/oxoprolinase family protein [Deltaproteobacteria bacterium]|nr:hydantoinase/oxoprolinase family protein [Deltaproteobacteria bacterium]